MSEWTDELKDEIVTKYLEQNPTPANSMQIVEELAEEYEKTVNGVRIILSKKGVYVKKTPATTSDKKEGTKSTRVSKQESIDALTAKIEELGATVEPEILDKLTGKAAVYFLGVINTVAE